MVPERVRLLPVLLDADLFHPVNDLAVELFLYGDVRHGRGWRSAVPVLLAGREPDNITMPDLLDRTAFALSPAEARGHDERLPKRMRMPCISCTGFEGHNSALNKRRIRRLEKQMDTHPPSEPLRRSCRGRL